MPFGTVSGLKSTEKYHFGDFESIVKNRLNLGTLNLKSQKQSIFEDTENRQATPLSGTIF